MIARVRKALAAAAGSAIAVFVTANADNVVTSEEWGGIIGAAIAMFITVYLVPNAGGGTEPDRDFVEDTGVVE